MRGSQGTLQRHVALMEMLFVSLPTISQEGPWQLMAAPWGAVHGESPEPPTGSGGQAMSLPVGHRAQQGWAVLWSGREHPGGRAAPSLQADAWQQDSTARLREALNPARSTVSRQPAVS